jgi:hypothetical protein
VISINKKFISKEGTNIPDSKMVNIKWMQNSVQVTAIDKTNDGFKRIRKKSKTEFIDLETGEIIQNKKSSMSKGENIDSARKSIKKGKDLIINNFQGKENEVFITLTYCEIMVDHRRLYKDFGKFWKKLKYHYGNIDYISIVEPQASGSWHCHVLVRSNDKEKIIIPHDELSELWGFGHVRIERIYDAKGLAGYLLKGKRLELYPSGMNMVRPSRGIKKPKSEKLLYIQVKEKVGDATPDFSSTTFILNEENRVLNTISKENYIINRPMEDSWK